MSSDHQNRSDAEMLSKRTAGLTASRIQAETEEGR